MRHTLALLGVLALAGCGGSDRVSGYRISVAPPHGWHVEIRRGAVVARGDVLSVLLYEDTPDAQWSPPLEYADYTADRRAPFALRDFARARDARRNFTVAGRYFDLFVHRASTTRPRRARPARGLAADRVGRLLPRRRRGLRGEDPAMHSR